MCHHEHTHTRTLEHTLCTRFALSGIIFTQTHTLSSIVESIIKGLFALSRPAPIVFPPHCNSVGAEGARPSSPLEFISHGTRRLQWKRRENSIMIPFLAYRHSHASPHAHIICCAFGTAISRALRPSSPAAISTWYAQTQTHTRTYIRTRACTTKRPCCCRATRRVSCRTVGVAAVA